MHSHITKVEAAINDLRQGKMIILTDHHEREDEGDIIFPAEIVTPAIINFMIKHCSGIICLSLMREQLQKLGLDYMVAPEKNTSAHGTPFTISIEAKFGVTTGVSAQDRAKTILAATKLDANENDIVKPGHIFPLHASDGGVLTRAGHTEGAIDIVHLAGFKKAAILCEVMNADGTMARGKKLKEFAEEHQIKMLAIDDIISYRLTKENLIAEEITTHLPLLKYGMLNMLVVKEKFNHNEHIVLSNETKTTLQPLVRIHSACITGDLFGSQRCDCNLQLDYSLQKISREGGLLIYLNQEGRGIGLFNKIKSYVLQENGYDTVSANQHLGLDIDAREYYLAANILRNKNISSIRLLTNNPHKINNLKKYGIKKIKREELPVFYNDFNKKYLLTKKEKLHHAFDVNFL